MAKLVSKTYGDALFEVAVEEGTLDTMLEEVEAVLQVLKGNKEYINLLSHPKIPVDEKKAMVEEAFKDKVSPELAGFLITIVEKGRFTEIEDILSYFMSRVWEEKKTGVACVTSAAVLSETQKKEIEAKLLETTSYVQFRMDYAVNPALIGGMVIKIGDRVVDGSVKTKLENMAKELNKIQLSN
ncbi:MAG: F0F1 ATP synthase subunit delta [Lachnospiraceae bacterium]|nr:F0F1 ATP synthase subunit delta [Lachnospiraceae bacterium]